jgi:hypothetical protein
MTIAGNRNQHTRNKTPMSISLSVLPFTATVLNAVDELIDL